MRLCEFQKKEVINSCDCSKIGYVTDLIFDECSGCIEAIIVPKGGRRRYRACDTISVHQKDRPGYYIGRNA